MPLALMDFRPYHLINCAAYEQFIVSVGINHLSKKYQLTTKVNKFASSISDRVFTLLLIRVIIITVSLCGWFVVLGI